MIKVPFPKEGEYPPYFANYYKMLGHNNPADLLVSRLAEATALWRSIPEENGLYAYADGKWTIKQVIGHITDSERVFGYRMMCFSRGEVQSLPSFEENDYAANAGHNNRTLSSIIDEWEAIRKSNILLASAFTAHDLEKTGVANSYKTSIAAVIYAIVAHEMHHTNVLKERYGI